MPAPRIAQALELVAAVRAALDAAGLEKAAASIDANDVPSGSRYGIVVVSPPALDFSDSFTEVAATFELHVIAAPADNYLAAWEVIDGIIQALVDGRINLRKGEVGSYQPYQGPALPAYTLTANDPE